MCPKPAPKASWKGKATQRRGCGRKMRERPGKRAFLQEHCLRRRKRTPGVDFGPLLDVLADGTAMPFVVIDGHGVFIPSTAQAAQAGRFPIYGMGLLARCPVRRHWETV